MATFSHHAHGLREGQKDLLEGHATSAHFRPYSTTSDDDLATKEDTRSGYPETSLKTAMASEEHPLRRRHPAHTVRFWSIPLFFSFVLFFFIPSAIDLRSLEWPSSWSVNGILAAIRSKELYYTDDVREVTRGVFKRTDEVQFDKYSLILKGQRVFLHSGEFHTFRLPVPALWTDIFEKAKAAGLNSISLYTHMGLINPAPGVVDFEGIRALQPFYGAAKEAGIWIVLRPGPYINAETSAGGIAHWATTEVKGDLRTNDTDWKEAWEAYVNGIIKETQGNQIHEGGVVIAVQIDNEYRQDDEKGAEYFVDLLAAYRDNNITVPLTYNDPGARRNFINGTGAVDLYGLDSYPQRFDCSNPLVWKPVVPDYHQYHMSANPSQPWYIPEFQAGSFDAWGPTAPGYDPCRTLTGEDFQSVFNLQLWASNAKLINYYMFYGGTSWGSSSFPGVYTSYDYGAPITESRELTDKYTELKRQGLFLRSSPEFYKTDWIADSSTGLVASDNADAFVTYLRNPDTGAGFYVIRQKDSTSTNTIAFKLNVTTSTGPLRLPLTTSSIQLHGRQSKLIFTDYHFGSSFSSSLAYSSAQILFAGSIDNRDVLFLHGDSRQTHEAALKLTGLPRKIDALKNLPAGVTISQLTSAALDAEGLKAGTALVTFATGLEGFVTVWDSSDLLVVYADTTTAGTFWAPAIPNSKATGEEANFKSFWSIGTNETVLVGGPYLVRSADIIDERKTLVLRGDLKEGVRLTVVAPLSIRKITWNGEDVSADLQLTSIPASSVITTHTVPLSSSVQSLTQGVGVPKLTGWKYHDSLPEVNEDGYDDSHWVAADRRETNSPYKPYYGDGRVLYGCDYGFCENVVLWRGHFEATGMEKSVNLSVNGGEAFSASVWLNDVFLGTSFGNSTNNRRIIEETDDRFEFPVGALRAGEDNVITIVQDNMGLNETDENTNTSKGPRGVRGFRLDTGTPFGDWKVQGKVGGYKRYPDKTRGIFNEGGLFGERKGWHLPNFDTSSEGWVTRDLSLGLPNSSAGVGFFVTTFKLDTPEGLDIMMSFTFEEDFGQPYRAFLFVNGWMMGKRVGNLGPQKRFPVHEGILDYHGENTVAVALWAMLPGVPATPKLELTLNAVYDGGLGTIVPNNPGWSIIGREAD